MNVPRALGRIAPRGGHRLCGHAGGLSARAHACRSAGLIALSSLLLSSLVPVAGAAPGAGDSGGQGEVPAPVQILDLTTASGQATEVAQSGLDDARASTGQGSGSADATSASAAAVLGATATVPTLAQATGAADAPVPSILPAATDPQADAALLTDPLEVDRFFVAGFTWTGGADLPDGVRIYLRVRENGSWSPWYLSEAADSGRDDRATPGTGEFVTGGADAIQASVVGSSLPAGLKLALVPSRPQGEEVLGADDLTTTQAAPTPVIEDASATENQGTQVDPVAMTLPASPAPVARPAAASFAAPAAVPVVAPAATTANGLPVAVTTRAEWGANASYMSWDPEYARAGHVVVHHTAGTNSYSAGQSASIVRGIYYYHAVVLDWGDIGYNFLVDKFGTVFEGRSGSVAAPAGRMSIGAHARGVNTGTMGISMMGDYSTVSPSDAQLSSVGKMAGWFLKRAGISDATGWAGLHVWTTERYQAGSTISMPRILGHRDVGYTTCPGNVGYSKLGAIRAIAKAQGSSPQGGSSSASSTVPQDHPGAVALRGALGANGWIGAATSGVQASAKGGVFQRFEHGVGYWSPATGAQFVGEPVLSAWGAYGYQTGSMGYPRSGGVAGVGGSRHQIFEGGIAYWRPGGRVSFIRGPILTGWGAAGWERSWLGLPTSNETASTKGGVFQRFERGVAYWSPATGAQFVGEPVLSAWGAYGYQTGSMGYPRSAGVAGVGGSRHQIFEGGIAYWRPGGRVSFIHGSILNAWAASGWEHSKVGLPTGRAVRQADGTMTQTFEKGSISVAPNGKVTIR
ncbi:N-acetylmuramoyl-L-alanine amidase [Actinomyces sp. oral taxon 175]|uniref:N-acetylmuramoyl-L-alanine amidase n=1 Tax=Actinomyces sp. oral taxon 175 TaxID=712119 RepID=UPI00021D1DB9|nr:N-acetylmuramoyl-L-alanine amidase [Actinomyces sp. oral taxon 175]EGV12396.1 N-acetylmuramoyl-L-alanine amidase [Actinomyces sp. oral taxon 175 str. F0384]